MEDSDLIKELKRLNNEKKRVLNVINSMYFINPQIRNKQFEKIKQINNEINKIIFKINLLKEKNSDKNNNSNRSTL